MNKKWVYNSNWERRYIHLKFHVLKTLSEKGSENKHQLFETFWRKENHNALISYHSAKDLHVFKTLSEKDSEKSLPLKPRIWNKYGGVGQPSLSVSTWHVVLDFAAGRTTKLQTQSACGTSGSWRNSALAGTRAIDGGRVWAPPAGRGIRGHRFHQRGIA